VQKIYKPLSERTPDWQYQSRLAYILKQGVIAEGLSQGQRAITAFGEVSPMRFDLSNGVPLITERNCINFWKKGVAEILAFINGARTIDQIHSFGTDYWESYRGMGSRLGLEPDDMGPGSYGPTFHDFPMPDGKGFNQMQNIVEQLASHPNIRSHRVVAWIPYYTPRGKGQRKVIVTPCHGNMHWRVLQGKLYLHMRQDSADMPIGVPSNMIQYAALLLMMCQVTGYPPGNYVHSFSDAHIYENQVDKVKELIERPPKPFPTLHLDPSIKNLFDFRIEHFELREYSPHPGMRIPFAP
jgi:thymidylate synthase